MCDIVAVVLVERAMISWWCCACENMLRISFMASCSLLCDLLMGMAIMVALQLSDGTFFVFICCYLLNVLCICSFLSYAHPVVPCEFHLNLWF